jgi:hypothetical protein
MEEQEIDFSVNIESLGLSVKASAELKRVNEIIARIEEQETDITDNLGIPYEKIGWSLTYFGEHGREPFMRTCKFANGFDAQTVSEKFTEHLDKKRKPDSAAGFYKWCKEAGIETRVGKQKMEGVKGGSQRDEMLNMLPYGADQEDWRRFGLWEQDGKYYSLTDKGYEREISNFNMKILFHIQNSNAEAYKIIHIKNDLNQERILHMNTDEFVTVGSFRKAMIRYGRFIFKGNDTDLLKLHDKLMREERHAKQIKVLGFDRGSKLWFFSNGLCAKDGLFIEADDNGVIEYQGKHYFIPSRNKSNDEFEDDYEADKRFIYMHSRVSFSEWATAYSKVYGKKGWIAIVYWFASIHSDLIFEDMQRFPILNLYGQKGSGKGALAESLLKLFGLGQHQLMLGGASTVVGFMRKLSQFSNSIIWFDEYKNNLLAKTIESLKNIYDRKGYERGKKDNSNQTQISRIFSTLILSGQDMPTIEPALFTRLIFLNFEPLKLTDEDRLQYKKLQDMEKSGISFLTVQGLKYRDQIEDSFKQLHSEESKWLLEKTKGHDIIERLIVNYAMLIAVARVMNDVLPLPFVVSEFREYCLELLKQQHFILSGSDDGSKFWEIVEQLFNNYLIEEGKDFELKDGFLVIRIQNVFGHYAKEMRQRNDPNVLQKSTLENYLTSDNRIFVERCKKQFADGSYTYAMVFKYRELGVNLIRRAERSETIEKMREMGVDVPDEKQFQKAQAQQAAMMMDSAMDEAERMDY